MLAIRGVRKSEMKNPKATVRAVMPVRPPSLMPLADSMYTCSARKGGGEAGRRAGSSGKSAFWPQMDILEETT